MALVFGPALRVTHVDEGLLLGLALVLMLLLGVGVGTRVVNAIPIEEEHPLVHLEVLNVQLRHELDNLDTLDSEPVVAPLCWTHIEDRDKLSQQVWPELLQSAC